MESSPHKSNVIGIDEAIEQAGGFGKFQWLYCILTALCYPTSGIFVYNLGYLTLKPVMMCPNEDGGHWLCKDGVRDIGKWH